MSEPRAPLLRSGIAVGALGGLSRLLGLLRDVLLALLLGVSLVSDVFFVALSLTQLLRGMALEGPLAQSLVSVCSSARLQGGLTRLRRLGAVMFSALTGITLPVVLLGLLLPALPVLFFGAGFLGDAERRVLAILMLPQALLYLLPAVWIGLAAALQNSSGRFAIPAATPVLFNLVIIAVLLLTQTGPEAAPRALAFSIPLAGLLQVLFHLGVLTRLGLLAPPSLEYKNPDFRRFGQLLGPALLTVLTVQAHVPINNLIASFLETGSISWLNYANRLSILPVGLVGVAAVTVLMPSLSRLATTGDEAAFGQTLRGGLSIIALLGLPAMAGIFLLARPIAFTLFQYGNMQVDDATRISWTLQILALSIPASMLISLLAGAFFARQDARSPLRIALLMLPVSLGLKLLLVVLAQLLFYSAWLGLALGVSLASWCNAWLLWRGLQRRGVILRPSIPGAAGRDALRIVLALLGMVLALWFSGIPQLPWEVLGWQQRVPNLVAAVAGGVLLYFALLWALRWKFPAIRMPGR